MNRSRGILFGILLAGLGSLALVTWLLAGRGEAEGRSGGLLTARHAEEASGVLPAAEAAAPEALDGGPGAAAGAPGEAASGGTAAGASPEPQRVLRGRALMVDGSALPGELGVFASRKCPPPVLFALTDVMGEQQETMGLFEFDVDVDALGEAADPSDDALAQASLVEAASDGRFELQAPATGVWLGVRAPGLCLTAPVHVPEGAEGEVELLLARGGSIEGRVIDALDRPMPRARVQGATPFDPYGVLDSSARMATLGTVGADEDGRFEFPQVPAGVALNLMAHAAGGRSAEAPGDAAADDADGPRQRVALQPARAEVPALRPGERRAVELVLTPAGAVRGVVVRTDGSPLAAATVRLRRTSMALKDVSLGDGAGMMDRAVTGDDGRFEFLAVADGRYEAVLAEQGWRLARATDLTIARGTVIDDLELVAEEGLAVSGRVLDQAGLPLEAARVHGFPPPSMMSFGATFERELRPDTVTDASGVFRLAGFDAGKVRLRVSRDGYRAQQLDVLAGDAGVEVRVSPLASVSGIVVSLVDGEPVPAFSVGLTPSEGLFQPGDMFGTEAESGFEKLVRPRRFSGREDGTFTLDGVTPGSYSMRVTADGFGARVEEDVEVTEAGRRGLVVMLEPECSVLGQVLDGRTGAPILGATVRTSKGGGIADMMDAMVQPGPSTRSDGQGRFRLAGLPAGPVRLTIEHLRFRTLGVPDVVLQAGEARDLGPLRMSAGAAVYGTVTDALGVVPDVSVMVSNATGSTLKRTTSDARGHYRVEGLPPGTYNVMRMDFQFDIGGDSTPMDLLEDLTFESVTLADGEEQRVDLRVRAEGGVRLHGQVTDAGGPVPQAMLTLLPESEGARLDITIADAEGAYEFDGVPAGRYGLQVTPMDSVAGQTQGQPGSPVFVALQLGALPEQRHDVALPGGVLNGLVVSADDGHAVPGVRVVLERTDEGVKEVSLLVAVGGRVAETFADVAGAFRFHHLPGGTYAVVAGGQNLLGMGASGWAQARVAEITVLEGSSGFTVKVEVEPSAVVAGTLTDIGGQPVSGAGVWVLDASGTPRSVFSEAVSSEGGSYEVSDLPDGTWTLAFMDGAHALTLVPGVLARTGERTPLDVTLPPGVPVRVALAGRSAASLEVSVSGPAGWLPSRLVSLTDLASLPQAAGTLAVGTYAPGHYQVLVMSGGETLFDSGVTLVPGSGPKLLELAEP